MSNMNQTKANPQGTGLELDQFVNTSLVDIVTQKIRTNIYTGKYEPGTRLIVRELSEDLGVSHTPIKEALNRLVAEGYVDALPRKSMVVREYNNRDFIERLEARLMCELYSIDAVMECLEKGEPLVEQLRAAMEEIDAAFQNSMVDCERWMKSESHFHEIYVGLCNNQYLLESYRNISSQRYSYFAFLQSRHITLNQSRYESDRQAHLNIIDALERKDRDAFRRAIVKHVTAVCAEHIETAADQIKMERLEKLAQ